MHTPKQMQDFYSELPRTLTNKLFKGKHPLGTPRLNGALNGGIEDEKEEQISTVQWATLRLGRHLVTPMGSKP